MTGNNKALTRIATARFTEEQLAEVELIARVLGISASEVFRIAIAEYITKYKNTPEFRQRLEQRIEQDRRLLERLIQEH